MSLGKTHRFVIFVAALVGGIYIGANFCQNAGLPTDTRGLPPGAIHGRGSSSAMGTAGAAVGVAHHADSMAGVGAQQQAGKERAEEEEEMQMKEERKGEKKRRKAT